MFVKEGSVIPFGKTDDKPDYDYSDGIEWNVYPSCDGKKHEGAVLDGNGNVIARLEVVTDCSGKVSYEKFGNGSDVSVIIK